MKTILLIRVPVPMLSPSQLSLKSLPCFQPSIVSFSTVTKMYSWDNWRKRRTKIEIRRIRTSNSFLGFWSLLFQYLLVFLTPRELLDPSPEISLLMSWMVGSLSSSSSSELNSCSGMSSTLLMVSSGTLPFMSAPSISFSSFPLLEMLLRFVLILLVGLSLLSLFASFETFLRKLLESTIFLIFLLLFIDFSLIFLTLRLVCDPVIVSFAALSPSPASTSLGLFLIVVINPWPSSSPSAQLDSFSLCSDPSLVLGFGSLCKGVSTSFPQISSMSSLL